MLTSFDSAASLRCATTALIRSVLVPFEEQNGDADAFPILKQTVGFA